MQKTKVDVDMAMQALDKLLKSNELNFAFLGKHLTGLGITDVDTPSFFNL